MSLAHLEDLLAAPVFDPQSVTAAAAGFPAPRAPGQAAVALVRIAGQAGYDRNLTWRRELQRSTDHLVGQHDDGRTFHVQISPGVVALRSLDLVRAERACERVRAAVTRDVDLTIQRPLYVPWLAAAGLERRVIREWSRKSRARMVRGFGERDWTSLHAGGGWTLGMGTLTYPGDWLRVAPTGRHAKRHLSALLRRFLRATGEPLRCAWKLEFQRPRQSGGSQGQEAPHFHLLASWPPLIAGRDARQWLAENWADIVNDGRGSEFDIAEYERHLKAGTAIDFQAGVSMTDPKRMAIYFLKHGTKALDGKEYQHNVPQAWQEAGCGRFWGFAGIRKLVHAVELDVEDFIVARRVLRKVARARAWRTASDREYWASRRQGWPDEFARARALNVRVPQRLRGGMGAGGSMTGGWVIVNDGARLAEDLARAVQLRRSLY